jgi:serine protease Do
MRYSGLILCAGLAGALGSCRSATAPPDLKAGAVAPTGYQVVVREVTAPPSLRIWTELAQSKHAPDFPLRADTFRNLARGANPAVVSIYSTQTSIGRTISDPLGILQFGLPLPRVGTALGSGFIIHRSGYVLTADHVIDRGRNIKVVLLKPREGKAEEYPAELVGKDKAAGVALLKIAPKHDLPVLPLGDSGKVEIGDQVLAVGNPYGFSHTVTSGIVSFTGRKLPSSGARGRKVEFIQIDAPINPGNSGGPLLNLSGEVVGINIAIAAQAQGIGFAVPVNAAKGAIPNLLSRR